MNIAILTEALPERGLGHVVRCGAIATSFLNAGHKIQFIVRGGRAFSREILDSRITVCHQEWINDFKLVEVQFDIVLVDSYEVGRGDLQKLRGETKVLSFLTDFENKGFPDNTVVFRYSSSVFFDYTALPEFVGSSLAPVRQAFLQKDHQLRGRRHRLKSILVTLGADDYRGLTQEIIQTIQKNGSFRITLVVVKTNPSLVKWAKEHSVSLRINLSGKELARQFRKTDLCITTAGSTAYELCSLAVPSILLLVVDNQVLNGKIFHEFGVPICDFRSPENRTLCFEEAFLKLSTAQNRVDLAAAMSQGTDGRGAERIAGTWLRIHGLATQEQVEVCPACANDSWWMWQINNQPDVRQMAFTQKSIPWLSHKQWFKKLLRDRNRRVLVATINKIPVGVLKLDKQEEDYVISIAVWYEARGKHVGTRLIETAKSQNFVTSRLIAHVKPENAASARMFDRLGFSFSPQSAENPRPFDVYVWRKLNPNHHAGNEKNE